VISVLYRALYLSLLLIILSLFIPNKAFAQAEIFGFGGYQVSSDITVSQGEVVVHSNPYYGAAFSFEAERGVQAEIMWIGQQTTMDFQQSNGITEPLFDIGIHYIQFGVIYEFREVSVQKVFPFMSFSLGTTLFSPTDGDYSDEWLFSITFGGGGKFYISKNVGIRLEARLLLPLNFSGGGMWCGSSGCGAVVGTWTSFLQADLTGGIFVRLGK